jgi:hypothetical protein
MNSNNKKFLFLPTVKGKGFSKAEIELLREFNPDIKILPDGTYTIDGQTSEEINANYKRTIKELIEIGKGKKKGLRFVPGKKKRGKT